MQTRITRSWSALRYDLSSQRAVDNAAKTVAEHDRLLAEIDALAQRLDAAQAAAAPTPASEPAARSSQEPPSQQVA